MPESRPSRRTLRSKRPTNAPGTVRGILLQATRFLYYLLTAKKGDVVSLELFEDVGIEHPDGSKTAEQDKSFRSANPLADRSLQLWKTLANWVASASAGILVPTRSRFVIYAPKAIMGPIVTGLHKAETSHAAAQAILSARELLTSAEGGWKAGQGLWPHLDVVFRADNALLVDIVRRFTVDSDRNSETALQPLLTDKLVGEDSVDDVLHWAEGWTKRTIERDLQRGLPPRVEQQKFHEALRNYVRTHDRENILRSVAAKATKREVDEQLSERDYVRQLRIIGLDYVDIVAAVNDFLRSSIDRTEWSSRGMISESSLEAFEEELALTWRNKRRRAVLAYEHNTDEEQGQLTYTDCIEYTTRLDGLDTPQTFVRGSWHALADDLTVGWHPKYKTILAAQRGHSSG